jgi:hypothetical protein
MFAKVLVLAVAALIAWAIVARTSQGAERERVYVVRPYDTLWSIAERSGGGDPRGLVWRIERRNHLHGSALVPGERLLVPR